MQTLADFNAALNSDFDVEGTAETLIHHVWKSRKRRIGHDMMVVNWVALFRALWIYVQAVILVTGLHEAGYNWDNLESVHRLFAPTYVVYGVVVLIYLASAVWSVRLLTRESDDLGLKVYREMSSRTRLLWHALPVPVHGVGLFLLVSVVGCHLNNAHRGSALCKLMPVRVVTAILCAGLTLDLLHILFNFYQIETHTREPEQKKLSANEQQQQQQLLQQQQQRALRRADGHLGYVVGGATGAGGGGGGDAVARDRRFFAATSVPSLSKLMTSREKDRRGRGGGREYRPRERVGGGGLGGASPASVPLLAAGAIDGGDDVDDDVYSLQSYNGGGGGGGGGAGMY